MYFLETNSRLKDSKVKNSASEAHCANRFRYEKEKKNY